MRMAAPAGAQSLLRRAARAVRPVPKSTHPAWQGLAELDAFQPGGWVLPATRSQFTLRRLLLVAPQHRPFSLRV